MMKKVGWSLAIWGGIGVINQFMLIQSLNSGVAPTFTALDSFDPATILKIANTTGAGFTSPGMLTDAAILAGGAFMAGKL